MKYLLIWELLLLMACLQLSFAWWPFAPPVSDEESELKAESKPPLQDGMIPFESLSAEHKFLQEAHKLLDLSPLDQCHHKVIATLRKSCGDMNEEDLAKLSVHLLNCQSHSEGRETFTCTADMTVADCTKPMNAHIWNTYHIISNRARSVCYSTRQQQFRLQTEAAVNQLSAATIQQLRAMESLAQSNQQIRQVTNESLMELKKEQDDILKRQSLLSSSQETLRDSIEENIAQLLAERNIMNQEQYQLKNITSAIHKQLEIAQEILINQEKKRQESQEKTNADLNELSNNLERVWNTIDTSTHVLLMRLTNISEQYDRTLINLKNINSTVTDILQALDTMNNGLGLQLSWLMDALGGAQDGLKNLVTLICHGLFLLFGCLFLLLLGTAWISRFSLVLLISINLTMEINFHWSLPLIQITALLLTIVIGEFGVGFYQRYSLSNTQLHPSLTSPDSSGSASLMEEISDSEIADLYEDINTHNGHLPCSPIVPTLSPHKATPTSSGFHSNGKCSSLTRSGLPCRLNANPPSPYCLRHNKKPI